MSDLSFSKIVSCTSEDVGYEATNLLKPTVASGKWRCKVGEKSVSVVLQLERSEKIGKIDIGNNGSAFVEVLVGHSSGSLDQFSVILPSSSFMSPVECKVQCGGNASRVRMFGQDKLTKPVCEHSWDLVKVVCTQPFNKTIPFGISFIKLYSPTDSKEVIQKQKSDEPLMGVSTKPAFSQSHSQAMPPASLKPVETVRPEISVTEVKRLTKRASSPEASLSPLKKTKNEESNNDKKAKPLVGVIFVLSGFQNPERSNLRSKAIELGAKYEADWSDSCTHLICAFANTPKFNQVKGHGKIISKKWIEDCYEKKALLDFRKYDMCSGEQVKVPNNRTGNFEKKKTSDDSENVSTNLISRLPNIFDSKSFHIHPSIDLDLSSKLKRLIITFGGSVLSKVSSATDFVIAEDTSNVTSIENDHPEIILVRPEWIFACQRKQKIVPYDQFTISPTT